MSSQLYRFTYVPTFDSVPIQVGVQGPSGTPNPYNKGFSLYKDGLIYHFQENSKSNTVGDP